MVECVRVYFSCRVWDCFSSPRSVVDAFICFDIIGVRIIGTNFIFVHLIATTTATITINSGVDSSLLPLVLVMISAAGAYSYCCYCYCYCCYCYCCSCYPYHPHRCDHFGFAIPPGHDGGQYRWRVSSSTRRASR